ncbi:MAG: CRISPR-associated protein Cas1 [Ilumatobacter sp.]
MTRRCRYLPMELEPVSEIPPYVPTRMVNDFVYFSRFFHLAWSTGETGENDYIVQGKWEHRGVDRVSGRPPSGDDPGSVRSTSVLVSSDRLGVIAKADVIESVDVTVVPVELKRGRERDSEHPVWDPERIQIAVTALMLRNNGFKVPYAEVRFTDSTKRARFELTAELIDETEAVVAQLKAVAPDPMPPPPLPLSTSRSRERGLGSVGNSYR